MVEAIDWDAALMESNIDHEHFLGTWESSFLLPSILSCSTSSNGAGASAPAPAQARREAVVRQVGWGGKGPVTALSLLPVLWGGSRLAGLNKVALRKTVLEYTSILELFPFKSDLIQYPRWLSAGPE